MRIFFWRQKSEKPEYEQLVENIKNKEKELKEMNSKKEGLELQLNEWYKRKSELETRKEEEKKAKEQEKKKLEEKVAKHSGPLTEEEALEAKLGEINRFKLALEKEQVGTNESEKKHFENKLLQLKAEYETMYNAYHEKKGIAGKGPDIGKLFEEEITARNGTKEKAERAEKKESLEEKASASVQPSAPISPILEYSLEQIEKEWETLEKERKKIIDYQKSFDEKSEKGMFSKEDKEKHEKEIEAMREEYGGMAKTYREKLAAFNSAKKSDVIQDQAKHEEVIKDYQPKDKFVKENKEEKREVETKPKKRRPRLLDEMMKAKAKKEENPILLAPVKKVSYTKEAKEKSAKKDVKKKDYFGKILRRGVFGLSALALGTGIAYNHKRITNLVNEKINSYAEAGSDIYQYFSSGDFSPKLTYELESEKAKTEEMQMLQKETEKVAEAKKEDIPTIAKKEEKKSFLQELKEGNWNYEVKKGDGIYALAEKYHAERNLEQAILPWLKRSFARMTISENKNRYPQIAGGQFCVYTKDGKTIAEKIGREFDYNNCDKAKFYKHGDIDEGWKLSFKWLGEIEKGKVPEIWKKEWEKRKI